MIPYELLIKVYEQSKKISPKLTKVQLFIYPLNHLFNKHVLLD